MLTIRKQVNQVLSALSTVPPTAAPGSSSHKVPVQPISVQSTPRQFEDFMRSITKLRTLGEARRLRSDIDREYRHARAAFRAASKRSKEDGADNEKAIRHIDRYLHRLERARGAIDHRIEKLSGDTVSLEEQNLKLISGVPAAGCTVGEWARTDYQADALPYPVRPVFACVLARIYGA